MLNLFSFASSCTLITIAFGFFLEKREMNDRIIGFSFCVLWGIVTFFLLSKDIGFYIHHPHLLYLNEPFELFLGPLLYCHFRILIEGKIKWNLLYVFLFLPGVLAVFYFIPFFMLSPAEKLASVEFHTVPSGIVRGIYLVILHGQTPWFVFCILLFIIHALRVLSAKGLRLIMQKKVLVAYCLSCIGIAVTGYSIMSLGYNLMLRVMIIVTNYMVIGFYYLEGKHSNFFLAIRKDASETRYKRSMLRGLDTEAIIDRINELMSLENIYLDEDLSLQSLSFKMSITPHQLSEILNGRLQTNFRSFINTYRINAVKKMLLEQDHSNILQIAYQCGFKSKNVFNTAFHKQEGMTPTEFLEKNKKTPS